MKMVYDSRGDLMFVKEVVEGGVLASLEEDEPVQFLSHGSYHIATWDVGERAVSRGYLVNGRYFATDPVAVSRIFARMFGAHFAIQRHAPFYIDVKPGIFRGVLKENGWSGTFKTCEGEKYTIENDRTDGIAWMDAREEEIAFDFADVDIDPEDLEPFDEDVFAKREGA